MVERLIHTLQALAAPPDVQLGRFPDFVAKGDELALDFDDALQLVYDCPQLQLEAHQHESLDRLYRYLEERSARDRAAFWTEAAIQSSPEWVAVRRLAVSALTSLGAPIDLPPPTDAVYVRDRAT